MKIAAFPPNPPAAHLRYAPFWGTRTTKMAETGKPGSTHMGVLGVFSSVWGSFFSFFCSPWGTRVSRGLQDLCEAFARFAVISSGPFCLNWYFQRHFSGLDSPPKRTFTPNHSAFGVHHCDWRGVCSGDRGWACPTNNHPTRDRPRSNQTPRNHLNRNHLNRKKRTGNQLNRKCPNRTPGRLLANRALFRMTASGPKCRP